MSLKKSVYLVLIMLLVALVALSVNVVFAQSTDGTRTTEDNLADEIPPAEHPPQCHKVPTFAPGVLILECWDAGDDIAIVDVKTSHKYDLVWNNKFVNLTVFVDPASSDTNVATWFVWDKEGAMATGSLP